MEPIDHYCFLSRICEKDFFSNKRKCEDRGVFFLYFFKGVSFLVFIVNRYLLYWVHNKRTYPSFLPQNPHHFCKEEGHCHYNHLIADFTATPLCHFQFYVCWAGLRTEVEKKKLVLRHYCNSRAGQSTLRENPAAVWPWRGPGWQAEGPVEDTPVTAVSFHGPCRSWSTAAPLHILIVQGNWQLV